MSFASKLTAAVKMPRIAWSFSQLGYRHRARAFDEADLAVDLTGQHHVVTGANGGLGLAMSKALAKRGAEVWMVCRNPERGRRAKAEVEALNRAPVHLVLGDLGDLDSVDGIAAALGCPRVDALIHNAGALVHELRRTPDDLELTFAVHVVGPQRLTRACLAKLRAAHDPRVVWVSSGGMYAERLSLTDSLQPPEPFDGVRAYALAKRAQVVLTQHWASEAPEVSFYAMHPGWAETPGVRTSLPAFHTVTQRWLRTPDEGADTAVWLAAAKTLPVPSGAFVFDRAEAPRHILPDTEATESVEAELWRTVERLAAGSTPSIDDN